MTEKSNLNQKSVIQQFDQFIKTVDEEITKSINLKDNKLTKHISSIQWELWKNYKGINGTSAGFHGISEYIVFSTFKNFVEDLNKPQKFKSKIINRDLCFFELEKNNKFLRVYRASSLKHFPIDSKLNRAPDIAILKKESNAFKPVVIIEIKNYLDKGNINSAIKILSQIQEEFKGDYTKYALFSFGRISVGNEKTIDSLKEFQENKNRFLITNEEGNEEVKLDSLMPRDNKKVKFKVIDLSEFFSIIKDEVTL